MKVSDVRDKSFSRYGRIIEGYDFSEVIAAVKRESYPKGVEYVAGVPALEALPVFSLFQKGFYGDMPVELGYCCGHNDRLDGLEYHRGSEVNIAVTDYVVMIGMQQDLGENFEYDTHKIECFYVTAGMAVEYYATTLHYCGLHTDPAGFAYATFLPKGTNTDLEPGFVPVQKEDKLLLARNKWFIGHPEAKKEGAYVSLYGPNWTMDDLEKSW